MYRYAIIFGIPALLIFRFDLFLKYLPKDFLGFIPLYGDLPIPMTHYVIGIGQLYNVSIVLLVLWILYQVRKNKLYYQNGLFRKDAVYMISGKTGKGKTRMMTRIARDCVADDTIVIANFFHDYDTLFFSSFQDFCLLQIDISLLGEQNNFDGKEKKIISKYFPNYFTILDENLRKKIKKIKGSYHFVTLGDEFYGYLHNRSFMSNFAKSEGKQLLMNLHQTRHSNQTLILASQDTDNLDLDIRQLAHNELDMKSWILDLFYGFNVYSYLSKKEMKAFGVEFLKNNRLPYFFFNTYLVYTLMNNTYRKMQEIWIFLARRVKKTYYHEIKDVVWLSGSRLGYNTKFNVKINIDSYKAGDLFDYILAREIKKI